MIRNRSDRIATSGARCSRQVGPEFDGSAGVLIRWIHHDQFGRPGTAIYEMCKVKEVVRKFGQLNDRQSRYGGWGCGVNLEGGDRDR